MTIDRLIEQAGDSNPQIFRELKERLTLRNISIAVAGALIIQVLVLMYFNAQIPIPILSEHPSDSSGLYRSTHNRYCDFANNFNSLRYDQCQIDGGSSFRINWQRWQADVFICLSFILPFGLILGSVYMLVTDLVREEKRGTLNFIRLSPQSAKQIFGGKILGVPILVYIAALVMLPLHLYLGCSAGSNLLYVGGWYLAIGSLWCLFASLSVLYVLLGGSQSILTTLVVSYPAWMPIVTINSFTSLTLNSDDSSGNSWWYEIPVFKNVISDIIGWGKSWFGIPVFSNAIRFDIFVTICFLVVSYWVWQALERRYLNPTATIISKSQSYSANLCWQVWIAGFVIPALAQNSSYDKASLGCLAGMDIIVLSLLIPLLLPSKQALQDWSRYRRERFTHQHRQFWQRELVQDLIHNNKSPALLAIALNIGMVMVLWIPISILFKDFSYGINILSGIGLGASVILIYAAIAHLGLFINVKNRKLWITALVGGVILAPSLMAWLLSTSHAPTELVSLLLLFSPFAVIGISQSGGVSILGALVAQLAIFAALTRQLQQKLQISGRSQTQELTGSN